MSRLSAFYCPKCATSFTISTEDVENVASIDCPRCNEELDVPESDDEGDEDGNVTQTIPPPVNDDGTNPLAHMRTVTEVSRYDEDFSIEPPPESDIVIELLRTWPEDLESDVSPRDEVGFYLSEPTAIMDLSIEPAIALVPTEIDHPTLNEFPGVKYFMPEDIWNRDTTYTATLQWGESEGELKTESWTFTTR